MIRFLFALILLCIITPAFAAKCPAGQQNPYGKCVRSKSKALATVAVPATGPRPPILVSPATGRGTRFLGNGSTIRNTTYGHVPIISRPRGVNDGILIEDVRTIGASALLRTYTYADATPNITIRRVAMLDHGPYGAMFRGASSGLIEDFRLISTRPNDDKSKVPGGIILGGKGTRDTGGPWTIRRFHIIGIQSAGSIFNGDGISTEGGYHDVSITDGYVGFNRDAGIDIKSRRTFVDRVTSEGNRRNFKLWISSTWGTITSINPCAPGRGACAHVQLQGDRTGKMRSLHIAKLIARSDNTTPVFQVENGPWEVTVDACELSLPKDTPISVGKATLHLGPGCNT